MFNKRLKSLRSSTGLTQEETAKKIGIARTTYAMYEQGKREPDISTLNSLANYFNVSVNYLLEENDKKKTLPELSKKDYRSIEKDLNDIINNLSNDGYAHFGGEGIQEFDQETQEAIINSLRASLVLARQLAKEKFTPDKYKK